MGEAPIFIVGPARSGTSLLYKALCLHPQVAYVSNWVQRYPAIPQLSVLNRVARRLPRARDNVWFPDGNAYVYNGPRSTARRMFPMAVEGEPIFTRCGISEVPGGVVEGVDPDLTALQRSVRTVVRTGGGKVFINKRIANILRIPLLDSAFPEARYVSLFRDGRAVALSLSKVNWWPDTVVWWAGMTPQEWERGGGDPWELCARNWVEEIRATEAGIAAVDASRRLHLRYEALTADPVSVLVDVAKFAGLDAEEPRWRHELARLEFPNRDDAWRRQLDERTAAAITDWQRTDLERLGYLTTGEAAHRTG